MFDRIQTRQARNGGRNRSILSLSQQGWGGVNYADDLYTMKKQHLPFAQNVDNGNPIGSITSVAGFESLITSLGTGKILGNHTWEHSAGDKIIAAWSNYLYLLSGASGAIAKTSQTDWEAGTRTHLDTTTSAGAMTLEKPGTDFSEADTLTADFNGTHSDTEAGTNCVQLAANSGARLYITNADAGYDPATERGDWDKTAGYRNEKMSKTKSGEIGGCDVTVGSTGADYDVLVVKAVSDALTSDKTIEGTLSWCLGVIETNAGLNGYYHIHAFVTQGDSDAARGTLLNNYIGSVEWGTSAVGVAVGAQAISSVAALTGDRIVIEIGYKATAAADTYQGMVYVGGTSATDLTAGAAATSYPGWFEFSNDPFATTYNLTGTYTHGAQDIHGAELAGAATIAFNTTTPADTAVVVQTRYTLDGATWTAWTTRASGATIIPASTDISAAGARVQWRATLTSVAGAATPTLNDVTVAVAAAYEVQGIWLSPVYNMLNTPLTATLAWTATTPAGTSVTWYAAGSPDGVVFGDWQTVAASGDAIPLLQYVKLKAILAGTVAATPTVSDLLISYSTSYTQANQLDISPLGRTDNKLTGNRVSMQDYDNRCYCADGLRSFVLYVDADTAVTGTAQQGTTDTIRLAAGASAVDNFFNNAFIAVTAGAGAGLARFISDYNGATKDVTVSQKWTNLLTNNQASVETDTTGLGMAGTNAAKGTLTRVTSGALYGSACAQVVVSGYTAGDDINLATTPEATAVAVLPNTAYSFSAYVKASAGAPCKLRVIQYTAGGATVLGTTFTTVVGTGAYLRLTGTLTTAATTAYVSQRIEFLGDGTFLIDGQQVEQAAAPTAFILSPDSTSGYSIGSAVKVRNAGVDAPTVAPTLADSGVSGTPNGAYLAKYSFVNADGYESNPSAASASQSVSSKQLTWTVPVDASAGNTTVARKLYRPKAGGAVYYYVATISDNTTTSFTDNIADAALTTLMLDNNNVPPAAVSLVYEFLSYMFYVSGDELWFSKAGQPENVPNITGDVQMNVCTSTILDIKSNPMALIPQGDNFINPITTNSGFVFDSDPTVDTTTMRRIDKNGCLSAWASDICIDPQMRSVLVFPTNTGVRLLLPGLQEESIEAIPLSRNIQPYFDKSVNRTNMAGIFHNNYYYLSFEYRADGAAANSFVTFALDFRTGEWYGPWTYGISCFTISNGVLYGGDPSNGKIYQMNTGSSFGGTDIEMIADLQMMAPKGENKTYKFNKFMMMVSADSDTTGLLVKPKVDNREVTVTPGVLTDTFTGETRPGHDNIRSRKYRIPLAKGSTISYRFEKTGSTPLSIQKIITECEELPLKR